MLQVGPGQPQCLEEREKNFSGKNTLAYFAAALADEKVVKPIEKFWCKFTIFVS
jgi:hypothetical protein